jgi:hypothetical protein
MYFEARSHELVPVADAAAAVRLIHSKEARAYQCPTWTNANGHRIALVDDSHINDGDFGECAVVNLDTQKQLESLTFAWIETEAEKLEAVTDCELDEGYRGNVIVPYDDTHKDTPATFECSCCGTLFPSTLRIQEPHDQDAGFGHCPNCP